MECQKNTPDPRQQQPFGAALWQGAASHFEILLNLVYRTTGEGRLKGEIKD